MNHVVTFANTIGPLNPSHNTAIKIIDSDFRAFQWGSNYLFRVPNYDLSTIAYSTGNDPDFYTYECGGDGEADPGNKDHKFGFGNVTDVPNNVWKYSFWLKDRTNTTGDPNRDDLNSIGQPIKTFYAGVNEHNTGYILHGEFHPLHQNTYHGTKNYYLKIRARVNQI